MNFFARFAGGVRLRKRKGFSLVELLVVAAIVASLMAMATPMIGSMLVNTRLDASTARIKGSLVQIQNILADNINTISRTDTMPRIPGATYDGVALVIRWDDAKAEYEMFYAQNNQAAKDSSGNFLESMTPRKKGYSRLLSFEPMTLSTGVRVVGLRRNNSKPSGLELIADNFIIGFDSQASATPSQQTVYVNLQTDTSTQAGAWNTSLYAGGPLSGASTGEGFQTSLPMVIVYSASAAGGLVVDGNLDPNILIRDAKGRVVMCPLQGGSPMDF